MPRDDFTQSVKDQLARRVAWRCSNPECHSATTGPRSDAELSVSIGVAAHIHAAAEGGPRYLDSQSAGERSSVSNGVWLCQNCAKLVDNDLLRFSASTLREWKLWAEGWALASIRAASEPAAPPSLSPPGVASLSNQPTPALACLEHLRLENLQAPWSALEPMFAEARVMTDGAGLRLGWEVVELSSGTESQLTSILDRFAAQSSAVVAKHRLGHHLLAVVAHGGTAGENESLATRFEAVCKQGNRGIRVLIGYMASVRFVDKVLVGA
jgi:hypothetical protein